MPFRRWRLSALLLLSCNCGVFAQFSQGQFFTSGLAIFSSPQANSQEHVGSSLSIAIAVGGNQGELQDFTPGASNSAGTGYDNLELFLISSNANINITVASNILTQENGSNVKHVNYQFPACITSGNYNLSLYETSRFNNDAIFVITQVPINVQNKKPSGGTCDGNQPVQGQPQNDAPLTGSPWLGTVSKLASGGVATLASSNNVLLASNPNPNPDPNPPQPQVVQLPPPQSDSPDPAAPNAEIASSTTSSQVTTAAFESSTKGGGQATNVPQPLSLSQVVVQTVTVTSNMFVGTAAVKGPSMNNGGVGILFPISDAQRTINPLLRLPTTIFATLLIICNVLLS